ncbi:MAG: Gfo/Idh/MocA family oxidoreductase [Candidatus Latescibacteria bacterium]|nr:Gfo/Idh/MocA family oxidoreductase [Candidatus Latescibacterota bacterium]
MSEPLRVAVIGASGIGQHHARWYHLVGCDVAAFVGTSEASCEKTQERLEAYFGFQGRAYQDVAQMLREEQPDIVDVSSPYPCHRDHALAAFEAGAHVVCEKPMCWDDSKALDDVLADGRAVAGAAARSDLLLGVSAQYPAVIPTYRAFYEDVQGRWEDVRSLSMEMEVKGRKGPKRHSEIWVDVASHPLSLVIGLLPGGRIDYETAVCEIEERENRARFDYVSSEGRCAVDLVLRDIDEGSPVRRFGVNGFSVDWEGYADDSGVYRALLKAGDQEVRCNDFLHLLIEGFVAAVRGERHRVVVAGEDGLLNLEQQVELLRLAQGGRG